MDISFVVDASASIWPQNFTIGLNFLEDFVGLFTISDTAVRVSLVTYGEIVYSQDAFNFGTYTDKEKLQKAIAAIPYRSGIRTNTSGGIWYMLKQQMPEARPDVRRVVVVLTDGNSQEADLTKQAALDAHQAGLEVFAIGVGQSVSDFELHNIASDERHVFVVDNYHMLDSITKRLAYETCNVDPFPICQMDPVDLAFVIDSSASIGQENFTRGMEFVREFVNSFDISPTAVRVAAITYGEKYYVQDAFGFDDHTDKNDLLSVLENIPWRHGTATNTSEGLKYMRENLMPAARAHAAHICVTITDGQSQEPLRTKEEAENARADHIVTYAVGVGKLGDTLDEEELNNIAGDPSRVLLAENYGQLNLIKEKLISITCSGILNALQSRSVMIKLRD